jgi:uncharacterized protein (DUF302 family)
MTENQNPKRRKVISAPSLIAGVFLGVVLTAAAGWTAMPRMMLTVHQSKYPDVDTTCQELKAAIESAGWICPAIRDMNKSMAQQGVHLTRPIRIVELCQADYAHDILGDNPEVSTLMPCALGVYEGVDGKVYISGMNTGLMGKMFGGKIAEVMGMKVSQDEEKILEGIVRL